MKLAVFGLTITSSWGNGHATLWRGLCSALHRRGHRVTFFEHDVPYYAAHRDVHALPGVELVLYQRWSDAVRRARTELRDADVAVVTSYCPDGIAASTLLTEYTSLRVFYDMDTPITLDSLERGEQLPYVGSRGLQDFDLVLSYTGGSALEALRTRLGARFVAPLYGSVDPTVHRPEPVRPHYRADLSYLGTYAADRQSALEQLFVEPARRLPNHRFVIGGAQYPDSFPWTDNIYFVRHLPPSEHPAFFSSSRLTLNVTRRAMAERGWCPSGRLFEAAACGVPILTDEWTGLDRFFEPGREILTTRHAADTMEALSMSDAELARVARAARERALAEHTADRRALELESMLDARRSATTQGVP